MHMQTVHLPAASRRALITGRAISGFVVLFLAVASAMPKLVGHVSATDAFVRLGYGADAGFRIGILELACAIVYALPRTAVLGAVVLTGFLGGAAASQFRIGDPWFVLPIAIGALAWVGLYLREPRLGGLLPVRQDRDA